MTLQLCSTDLVKIHIIALDNINVNVITRCYIVVVHLINNFSNVNNYVYHSNIESCFQFVVDRICLYPEIRDTDLYLQVSENFNES